MHSSRHKYQNGFTLVELLVTMVLLGIFLGSVYSLYITHIKTVYSREDVLDVQQNVRIAMDRLTRDIRMAGLFVAPPFDKAFSNYSTISIQTTPIDMTKVTISQILSEQAEKFVVTPTVTLADIGIGSNAVILRPATKVQIGGLFSVISSSTANGHLKISPLPTYPNVPVLGDMVCKVPTTFPEVIRYRIDRTDTAHGCDNSPCLLRNSDIIAQGINNIRFEYYLDGANTSPITFSNITSHADIGKVSALRVTVIGQTSRKNGADNTVKTRSLVTFVKLRNFR